MEQQQAASGTGCLAQVPPLSADREWDTDKDANTNPRRKKGKQTKAVNERKRERTRHERFLDVETFWRTTPPEKRRELLRVPMSALLEEANRRKEAGNAECVEDVIEGLVLLREQNNANARYWICPVCDQKFHTRRDYLHHVELFHEELALQDNKYVTCARCQAEVVGMYYSSSKQPSYNLCVKCYGTEAHQPASAPRQPFEKVYPRSPSAVRAWSETSDFISTRDSFSSMDDDYQQDVHGILPSSTRQLHPILTPPAAAEGSDEWGSAASAPSSQQGSAPRSPSPLPGRAGARSSASASAGQLCPDSPTAAAAANATQQQQQQPAGALAQQQGGVDAGLAMGTAGLHLPMAFPQPHECCEHGTQSSCAVAHGGAASQPQPIPCPSSASHQAGAGNPNSGEKSWSWWPKFSWNLSTSQEGRQWSLTQQRPPLYSPTASPPSTPPLQAPPRCSGPGGAEAAGSASSAGTGPQDPGDAAGAAGTRPRHATPLGMHGGLPPPPPLAPLLTGHPVAEDTEALVERLLIAAEEVAPCPPPARRVAAARAAAAHAELGARGRGEAAASAAAAAAGEAQLQGFGGTVAAGIPVCAPLPAGVVAGFPQGLPLPSDTALLAMAAAAHAELVAGGGLATADAVPEQAGVLISDAMAHMVESVMQRMREMYSTDRKVGDMSLGSITQFAFRKLCLMLDDPTASSPRASLPVDPTQARAVDEFVDQPSVVFQKPETLRAVLGCLSLADLQMVLAYVVRQHNDAMAQPDVGSSEASSSGGEGGDECSDSADDGCATLFELRLTDEDAFDRMIEEVWGYPEPMDSLGRAPNPSLRKHYGEEVQVMLSGGYGLNTSSEPFLDPAPWWLEHLCERSSLDEGGVGGESSVLRWVYGSVVSTALEEFAERQRALRGGRDRDSAISDLYEEVAAAWRTLQAATDQRNRLEELRKNARRQLALVRSLQEEGQHCSAEQAAEFLDALLSGYCAMQPGKAPTLYLCEAAVEVVRRHPQLAQDASQVYARALLDRELAVLALAEAMLAHQLQEAEKEVQRSEDATKAARKDVKDLEAEYNKVAADGPASHRKRDMLDKATKEAEHREKLADLHARAHAAQDRLATEENTRAAATSRRTALNAEIAGVRDHLRSHAVRKKSLDDVCAQLDAPMTAAAAVGDAAAGGPAGAAAAAAAPAAAPAALPVAPPAGPAPAGAAAAAAAAPATAAAGGSGGSPADLNWRAQRLECLMLRVWWVSEAVKMFRDQYSPHAGGRQYDLLIRATNWAKALAAEYDTTIKAQFSELDRLRSRVADMACVDQAHELHSCALEVMRRRVEAAAVVAREEASMLLLKELEAEETERRGVNPGGGTAGARKKAAAKPAAKASKAPERARRQESNSSSQGPQQQEEARRALEESERAAREEARRARELAIEAELEKRRAELELLAMRAAVEQANLAKQGQLQRAAQQRAAAAAAAEQPAAAQHAQQAELASPSKPRGALISQEDFASETDLDAATRAAIEASLQDLERYGLPLPQPDASSTSAAAVAQSAQGDNSAKANARRAAKAAAGTSANARRQRNRAVGDKEGTAQAVAATADDPTADLSNAHTYVDRLLSELSSPTAAPTAPPQPQPAAAPAVAAAAPARAGGRQRSNAAAGKVEAQVAGKRQPQQQQAQVQAPVPRPASEPEHAVDGSGFAISLSDPDNWPSLADAVSHPPKPQLPPATAAAAAGLVRTLSSSTRSGSEAGAEVLPPPPADPVPRPTSLGVPSPLTTQRILGQLPGRPVLALAAAAVVLQEAPDLPSFNPFAENPLQRALAREALSALDLAASPAREPRVAGPMQGLDLASPARLGGGLFDRSHADKLLFPGLDIERIPRSPSQQPSAATSRGPTVPPSPQDGQRPPSSLGTAVASPARMLFSNEVTSVNFSTAPGTPVSAPPEQQRIPIFGSSGMMLAFAAPSMAPPSFRMGLDRPGPQLLAARAMQFAGSGSGPFSRPQADLPPPPSSSSALNLPSNSSFAPPPPPGSIGFAPAAPLGGSGLQLSMPPPQPAGSMPAQHAQHSPMDLRAPNMAAISRPQPATQPIPVPMAPRPAQHSTAQGSAPMLQQQQLPMLPSSLGLDGPGSPHVSPAPLLADPRPRLAAPPASGLHHASAAAPGYPAGFPTHMARPQGFLGDAPGSRPQALPAGRPRMPSSAAPVPQHAQHRQQAGGFGGGRNAAAAAGVPQSPSAPRHGAMQSRLQPSAAPFYPAGLPKSPVVGLGGPYPTHADAAAAAAAAAGVHASGAAQQEWAIPQRAGTGPVPAGQPPARTPAAADPTRGRTSMDAIPDLAAMAKTPVSAYPVGGAPLVGFGGQSWTTMPGMQNGWLQQQAGSATRPLPPGAVPLQRPSMSLFVGDSVNWSVNQPAGMWPDMRWPGTQ